MAIHEYGNRKVEKISVSLWQYQGNLRELETDLKFLNAAFTTQHSQQINFDEQRLPQLVNDPGFCLLCARPKHIIEPKSIYESIRVIKRFCGESKRKILIPSLKNIEVGMVR